VPIVQDSGSVDLSALAASGGGSVGCVLIQDDPGPWAISARYDVLGQVYGPGVFLDPALAQPFAFVQIREGRGRAQQTWSFTREYFILRDFSAQLIAASLDVTIVVPSGLIGPFAPVTMQVWAVKGPTCEHEFSGRLIVAGSLALLQSSINVTGVDASVPRGSTSMRITVPTSGDTGAPFGPFPALLDVYQLDQFGNPIQINSISQAERVEQLVCLSPLCFFVGVVDPTAAITLGSIPCTWRTHG